MQHMRKIINNTKSLGRPRCRREVNIKVNLTETDYEDAG
jgi:hypothetical protein